MTAIHECGGAKSDVCVCQEQQTALHISARLGNVDNVALLLQHGAQPNSTSKDMCTALHITAKEGHDDVAVVLLEHGADQTLLTKVTTAASSGSGFTTGGGQISFEGQFQGFRGILDHTLADSDCWNVDLLADLAKVIPIIV